MNPSNRKINYNLLFWVLTLFTAVVRILTASRIGLTGDEAHYWTYFQHPELSYFDHPPAVGYIIGFFTLLFGNNEFAVRLPAVIAFIATSYLIYLLAKDLFDEQTAFTAVILLNIIPVFSFLGSVITIPDAPLSALWTLFVFLFWKLMKEGKPYYWYLLGITLGLGLLCKYNAILLVPSFCLVLLLSPKHRFWFKRAEPYLSVLIGFVLFIPVIIWNLQNGWASFGFQLRHGLGKAVPHFSLTFLSRSLGAQAGYISPFLFILFWFVLFWMVIRYLKDKDEKILLLASFTLPTLLVFNGVSFFNEILPHWPVMGYLILVIGAAHFILLKWHNKYFRVFTYISCVLALALTVLVPLQALFKVIPPESFIPKAEASKLEDGITKAEKIDITNELYGWKEAGRKIQDILDRSPFPKPFVFTHRHYIASQLGFYIPSHPIVYCLSDRIDAYDFWQRDLSSLDKRDGIFVTNDYFFTDPRTVFPFKSWNKTEQLEILRGNRKVRLFYLTYGKKFNLKKLPSEYSSQLAGPKLSLKGSLTDLDTNAFWIINKKVRVRILDYTLSKITQMEAVLNVNLSLIFFVLVTAGILWKNKRDSFWTDIFVLLVVLWVGGLLVHYLKDLFERTRPLGLFGNQVNVFYEKLERGAFPSGHSQIAFALAAFLTWRVKKYWWLFFGAACFAGYTRVYVGSHFPSDVVGGAAVGIITALLGVWLIKIIDAIRHRQAIKKSNE